LFDTLSIPQCGKQFKGIDMCGSSNGDQLLRHTGSGIDIILEVFGLWAVLLLLTLFLFLLLPVLLLLGLQFEAPAAIRRPVCRT
jgi:hypothetical protein